MGGEKDVNNYWPGLSSLNLRQINPRDWEPETGLREILSARLDQIRSDPLDWRCSKMTALHCCALKHIPDIVSMSDGGWLMSIQFQPISSYISAQVGSLC